MARLHARIIHFPFAASLQGALLDSYREEQQSEKLFLTLNVRSFEPTAPSELFEHDGFVYERIRGMYVPFRLRFFKVSELKGSDPYRNIIHLPRDDPARIIEDLLSWRQPNKENIFFFLGMQASLAESLMFVARHVTYERVSGDSISSTIERDWCPPPLLPGRLIPQPRRLHKRFGGDPITIKVNGQVFHRRLFIGGTDIQPTERPHVDTVINLGENPSRWLKGNDIPPQDRAINKGEGANGMAVEEIQEEADWIIDRLKKNQRVLVHCAAGMNRSATICCAVLMLLEGLSAEKALERVREHHPWARPDSHHWLALRWLEKNRKE